MPLALAIYLKSSGINKSKKQRIIMARREFDKAMGGGVDWGWGAVEDMTEGCPFTDDQLDALREDYDLSDGSIGPDDDLVEA